MTEWSPPPTWWTASAPPPPPPPPAPKPPRSKLGVIVGIVLGLIAFSGAGWLGWQILRESGPDHPDEWDPRVADLADFVERERDLRFDHPVYVDFLSAEEYSDLTRRDETGLTDTDREELERAEGMFRALGLAEGDLDLFEAFNDVVDSGTLAFYDRGDERVRVRGTELTPGLRVTLVHELTHALQDQHFDLDPLAGDPATDGQALGLRALAEGDATGIEEAYTSDELSPDDLADYEEEHEGEISQAEADLHDVPAALTAMFSAPYDLGAPLVLGLRNEGGNERLDEAYGDAPDTEEDLFSPLTYLEPERDEGGDEPTEIDLGVDEPLEEDTFGAVSWYLLLVERIDPQLALAATDGWDGDRYAIVEEDERTCVHVAFAGDESSDEEAMADAIDDWVEAMPAGDARSEEFDGHPGLVSCDPGPDADLALSGRSERGLTIPSLRSFLVSDALGHVDLDAAICYSERVLGALTFDEITDPEGAVFADSRFQQIVQSAIGTCT